jgi:hypothetical protein
MSGEKRKQEEREEDSFLSNQQHVLSVSATASNEPMTNFQTHVGEEEEAARMYEINEDGHEQEKRGWEETSTPTENIDADNPEAVLSDALRHFGQNDLPDTGDSLDVDALLDKMLEDNCRTIEEELQRQIDQQLDDALQKQLDEQMDEYLRQQEVEEEMGDVGDAEWEQEEEEEEEDILVKMGINKKRPRNSRSAVDKYLEDQLEEQLLSQQMEQMLNLGRGPPTIAEINSDIQKLIERYQEEETKRQTREN